MTRWMYQVNGGVEVSAESREEDQGIRGARREQRPGLLMVGNFLSGSLGTRFVCEDLALRLSGAGWEVYRTSERVSRLMRLGDMLATIWGERRKYDVAQVDVYSGSAFLWAELSCGLLKRLGKRFVLTLHGGNLPEFGKRHPRRVRRLLRSAAAVTAPSEFLRERMAPYCAGLELVPNPLDVGRYEFRARREVNPRLLWLRAYHRIYAPEVAVRVVAALKEEFPGVRLAMIGRDAGDGSREEVIQLGARLGVLKVEVPQKLQEGDVFLNTARVDNTPITVMEAMACGLPVVSTNAGGVPNLVKDGSEGLLTRPDDVEGMAKAVRRVLREHGLGERLGRAGRKKVERFDWGVVLPQWESILERVARGER
jgi:glycosyltransferase involved in cell wall biosynthesis